MGEGRCSKCPSLQDTKLLGDGTHSATLGRLWFRPLGGASLRTREKAPGEKPLSSNLLTYSLSSGVVCVYCCIQAKFPQ